MYLNFKTIFLKNIKFWANLVGLFLFCLPSFGESPEFNQQWLELLRYRPSIIHGYKSEQDRPEFFLTENGKYNPQAEWNEFILKAQKEFSKGHIICDFPARFLYAVKMGVKGLPKKSQLNQCAQYFKFKEKLRPKAITLEFSSYFVQNPASAFGHTLMRFSKRSLNPGNRKFELLDYGLNYSATVTTQSPLLYGVYGILGGFEGSFLSLPYFYKVREYSDSESRDLWIYELNMTKEQIDFLVAHTWEMSKAGFTYYYFSENCSYHLLGLLNAVNPKWNLIEKTPTFVIPVDTIKILTRTPDLVKKVHYRPSNFAQFKAFKNNINSKNEDLVKEIIANDFTLNPLNQKSEKDKAEILDTLIAFVDFKYAEDVLREEDKISKLKRKLLIARAQTGVKSDSPKVSPDFDQAPHLSHDSKRLKLSYSYSDTLKKYYRFQHRFALHDLEDNNQGHMSSSKIEMGVIGFNYFENKVRSKNLFLDHFYIARVLNLSPINFYAMPISFKLDFGMKREFDQECFNCSIYGLELAPGVGFKLPGNIILYGLTHGDFQYVPSLGKNHVRLLYGGTTGLLFNYFESFKLHLFYKASWSEFSDLDFKEEFKFIGQFNLGTTASISTEFENQERQTLSSINLMAYY